MYSMTIGAWFRSQSTWTLTTIAAELGVSPGTVHRWVNDEDPGIVAKHWCQLVEISGRRITAEAQFGVRRRAKRAA